jgi:hypothetical protein
MRSSTMVKNIIDEVVENFIFESISMEHENFKFRQNIKNSSFYNYSSFSQDFDVDINESSVFVNWHIAFWLNDLGIENFIVVIDSVDGQYRLDLLDKQTDELTQQTDKDIAGTEWKFEVDDANLHMNDSLYIDMLDFDFKTNTCRVTFFDSQR